MFFKSRALSKRSCILESALNYLITYLSIIFISNNWFSHGNIACRSTVKYLSRWSFFLYNQFLRIISIVALPKFQASSLRKHYFPQICDYIFYARIFRDLNLTFSGHTRSCNRIFFFRHRIQGSKSWICWISIIIIIILIWN